MLQSFRIPEGIDYVKLPCLKRDQDGNLAVRSLRHMEVKEVVDARRDLLFSVIHGFRPDLLLVDKKPSGLSGELLTSIVELKLARPHAKVVLVMRDILDSPERTVTIWKQHRDYEVLQAYYDGVLVLGTRDLFDVCTEYEMPQAVRNVVEFCGYIRPAPSPVTRDQVRRQWGIGESETMVLVTTGGGEDGCHVASNYILGLKSLAPDKRPASVVITGPESSAAHQTDITTLAMLYPSVRVIEFADDVMGLMNAADVVVSMGGYNTICEIVSLGKRAIVVPRMRPVAEQWIRAERMSARGLFRTLHPDLLTPTSLMDAVSAQLAAHRANPHWQADLDMEALPRIAEFVRHTNRAPEAASAGAFTFFARA